MTQRLQALWAGGRHLLWLAAMFAVLTMLVRVRLEVGELRERLDRSGHEIEAAEVLHGRLAAEIDARTRIQDLRREAGNLQLGAPVAVVDLPETLQP